MKNAPSLAIFCYFFAKINCDRFLPETGDRHRLTLKQNEYLAIAKIAQLSKAGPNSPAGKKILICTHFSALRGVLEATGAISNLNLGIFLGFCIVGNKNGDKINFNYLWQIREQKIRLIYHSFGFNQARCSLVLAEKDNTCMPTTP